MVREYKAKQSKVIGGSEELAKTVQKVFKICKWLANRYCVSAEDIHIDYKFTKEDLINNTFTIKITFK